MAANQLLNPSFNWGDLVQVKSAAPLCYNAGELGSVTGIRKIEKDQVSDQFQQFKDTYLYLIEFGNGDAIEIPEIFLIKIS